MPFKFSICIFHPTHFLFTCLYLYKFIFTPKSGPGTSTAAPIKFFLANSSVYLLINVSTSLLENLRGLIPIPPFAPPYGKSNIEFFNVIKNESASTSSILICGLSLVPPFVGNLYVLCYALYAGTYKNIKKYIITQIYVPSSLTNGKLNFINISVLL